MKIYPIIVISLLVTQISFFVLAHVGLFDYYTLTIELFVWPTVAMVSIVFAVIQIFRTKGQIGGKNGTNIVLLIVSIISFLIPLYWIYIVSSYSCDYNDCSDDFTIQS